MTIKANSASKSDASSQDEMRSSQKILDVLCQNTHMQFGVIRVIKDKSWSNWCMYDYHSQLLTVDDSQEYIKVYQEIRVGLNPVFIQDSNLCGNKAWREILNGVGMRSYISFPIIDKNNIILGHLSFMDTKPVHFDNEKLSMLLPFCGDLIAIDFIKVFGLRYTNIILDNERKYSRKRDIILSSLAHDLNNPLSAVKMLSQFLKEKLSDEKHKKVAKRIEDSSLRMKNMIDDILDFSIEKMGIDSAIKKEPVCMESLIKQVLDEFAPQVIRFVSLRINIHRNVICNKTKIGRAISNLISNSIKHGRPGKKIEIDSYIKNNNFVFQIENHIIRTKSKSFQNLFSPFEKSEQSDGLGLGLYIVQQIARIHSGEIQFILREDKITFKFVIPLVDQVYNCTN
ncbi:MAG: GAF domain-containing sensor histidine kinase [Sphingobacterium sp.]|jgi:K+-sensing histidine kinase KdpD|nr:GAF domain-containing sensor histidine kinase [Sphingobacterium sp.]